MPVGNSYNLSRVIGIRQIDGPRIPRDIYQPASFSSYHVRPAICTNDWVKGLVLNTKLEGHGGCVNTINYNSNGDLICTGSDDCKVGIWSGHSYKQIEAVTTGHHKNIFCAKFVPETNDRKLISCGMDGEIRLLDLEKVAEHTPATLISANENMLYKLEFMPANPTVFCSTQQDGTVRIFDLRVQNSFDEEDESNILIDLRGGKRSTVSINSLAFNPTGIPDFVVGCSDPYLRLFDIRYIDNSSYSSNPLKYFAPRSVIEKSSKKKEFNNYYYVTGVNYNNLGEICATYSRENCYSFNVDDKSPVEDVDDKQIQTNYIQCYTGHRNVRTFLKEVSFVGGNKYVATGSDCGNIFIWEKKSGELVQLLEGDDHVVNGIVEHPYLPFLASCGIDSEGKIWEYKPEEAKELDQKQIDLVMTGNKNAEEEEGISMLQLWNFLSRIRRTAREGIAEFSESDEESDSMDDSMDEDQNEEDVARAMLEQANQQRRSANSLFRQDLCEQATADYNRSLDILETIETDIPDLLEDISESKKLSILNKAACQLKLHRYDAVIQNCTTVLNEFDNNSIKALFRRGTALMHNGEYEEAKADYVRALELDPSDVIVQNALRNLEKQIANSSTNVVQNEKMEEDNEDDENVKKQDIKQNQENMQVDQEDEQLKEFYAQMHDDNLFVEKNCNPKNSQQENQKENNNNNNNIKNGDIIGRQNQNQNQEKENIENHQNIF